MGKKRKTSKGKLPAKKAKKLETFETIEKGEGGNTKTPSLLNYQTPFWFFTYNNYTFETIETIETILKHECKWFIFQEEKGAEGTPHLQGTICLKQKQRLSYIAKFDPKIHWEPTKSIKKSIEYCTKYESRAGKIYSMGIDVPKQATVEEPYGWQLEVMKALEEKPDKRTIHWYWEPDGNVGKSTFSKYLVVKKNALMLTGKSADMYHMLSKYPNKRDLIVVDVPRSSKEFINYGAIEQIKNGLVFSGKYEGSQLVFDSPHVVCFANQEPSIDKMSADRWHIVQINKHKEVANNSQ